MPNKFTFQLTLICLAALSVAFPLWLHANSTATGVIGAILMGATVPLLLLIACIRRTRNWSGITALCMIPFTVVGVMEIVATLGTPDMGMAVGVLAIVAFFSALDAGRRRKR